MKKAAFLTDDSTSKHDISSCEADSCLIKKVEAFHKRVEGEVFSGNRSAETLFVIPTSLIKSATVTFSNSAKPF